MKKAIALLYQISMAFYAPLPAILALKAGESPFFVGFLIALRSIIQQAGNLFWPKYVTRAQRAGIVSLGFFGIMLGALLLSTPQTIVPAVVVLALLPRGTYFYLLDEVRRTENDLKTEVADFYKINTYGTLAGTLIGSLAIYFVPTRDLPYVLFMISGLSSLLLSSIMGEEGLLPIFRKGLVELRSIDKSIRSTRFQIESVFGIKLFVPYLATSALFSLGFSFIYPQFPLFIGFILGNPSLYYIFAMVSRVFSIMGYHFSHKVEHTLFLGWLFRSLMFVSWIFAFRFHELVWLAFALSGFGWAFLNTFYETENLSFGHKLTSLNHFSRGAAYSIGSLFSGYFVSQGLLFTVLLSFGIMTVAPIPHVVGNILKKATSKNETGPVAQSVRAPVL